LPVELHKLYYSLQDNTAKEEEMGETCSTYGETRNAYRFSVAKPKAKRPFGIYTLYWEIILK
jgi:hypothetical protein